MPSISSIKTFSWRETEVGRISSAASHDLIEGFRGRIISSIELKITCTLHVDRVVQINRMTSIPDPDLKQSLPPKQDTECLS